jgi:pimeloyl-ACP methyl ester carboxylesterase
MPDVRDDYVHANGLRFRYRDWGGQGRPIVLLHGLASNARIWDFVAPKLVACGHVVAINQRGHGGSDRPESGYGFAEVTADLAGILEALKLTRPIVVGHSWGANVAVAFAGDYSEAVAGIALVDGGTMDISAQPGMTWEQAEKNMAPPRLVGTPRTSLLQRIRQGGDLGAFWSDEVESIIMAGFEVFPDDTIAPWLTFERHMQIVRAIWDYHGAELLGHVTCPVLLMPAIRAIDAERNERKLAAVAAAELAGAHVRTVWLQDSIHDVPLQRPQLVADTLTAFVRALDDPTHAGTAVEG